MTTHVNDNSIVRDQFLSECLDKDAYRLLIGHDFDESSVSKVNNLQDGEAFIYCKTKDTDIKAMEILTGLKFQLVDTLVTLEKDILMDEEYYYPNDIRLATVQDEEGTVNVATSNFEFSRFHADDNIAKEQADNIKGEWVRNYFKGQRGDHMVLGLVDNKVAGFCQLILDRDTLVIDLIAVDESARNKKLATQMINYAQQHCRGNCVKYRVGTQLANVPSLNLYQGMGFRIKNKQYIFHSFT